MNQTNQSKYMAEAKWALGTCFGSEHDNCGASKWNSNIMFHDLNASKAATWK